MIDWALDTISQELTWAVVVFLVVLAIAVIGLLKK